MQREQRQWMHWPLLGVLFCLLVGCAGPSTPGRFYVLSPAESLARGNAPSDLSVGVGPISLPPHLDRGQIITLASENRLELNELDQWAEPLKDGVVRVMATNLAGILNTQRVYQFPWRRPVTVQYQVAISILRFDTDARGLSVLTARWDLIRGDGQELIFSQTSTFSQQMVGSDIEPTVAAMSANLGELSREIATGIGTFAN